MFKKPKSVSGVLTLNFTPKKGGVVGLSGWFKRYKLCGWIKTAHYDYLALLK
ncbi:hypothetical protein VN1242_12030 [Helicobacter pylori]